MRKSTKAKNFKIFSVGDAHNQILESKASYITPGAHAIQHYGVTI